MKLDIRDLKRFKSMEAKIISNKGLIVGIELRCENYGNLRPYWLRIIASRARKGEIGIDVREVIDGKYLFILLGEGEIKFSIDDNRTLKRLKKIVNESVLEITDVKLNVGSFVIVVISLREIKDLNKREQHKRRLAFSLSNRNPTPTKNTDSKKIEEWKRIFA